MEGITSHSPSVLLSCGFHVRKSQIRSFLELFSFTKQGLYLLHRSVRPLQHFERQFRTRVNGETSDTFPIRSRVPQGSVLGPVLYLVHTSEIPTTENTLTGTFADDPAILASHEDPMTASTRLQHHINLLEAWATEWKIKINETKSTQCG